MYAVKIRESIMIAHSLPDPYFGPAQNMHGATYVVDVEFRSAKLNSKSVVLDIGEARNLLKSVLSQLDYQNLDDLTEFRGQLTTTEFLARFIHDQVKEVSASVFTGIVLVSLGESHNAWATYQGD